MVSTPFRRSLALLLLTCLLHQSQAKETLTTLLGLEEKTQETDDIMMIQRKIAVEQLKADESDIESCPYLYGEFVMESDGGTPRHGVVEQTGCNATFTLAPVLDFPCSISGNQFTIDLFGNKFSGTIVQTANTDLLVPRLSTVINLTAFTLTSISELPSFSDCVEARDTIMKLPKNLRWEYDCARNCFWPCAGGARCSCACSKNDPGAASFVMPKSGGKFEGPQCFDLKPQINHSLPTTMTTVAVVDATITTTTEYVNPEEAFRVTNDETLSVMGLAGKVHGSSGVFFFAGILMLASGFLFACCKPVQVDADNDCAGDHPTAEVPIPASGPLAHELNPALWFLAFLAQSVSYSAIIPGSYDLALQLGCGPVISGLVVSVIHFADGFVAVSMQLMPTEVPMAHRVIWFSSCCSSIVACLACWMCCLPGLQSPVLLIVSRSILGLSLGMQGYISFDAQLRMLSPEQLAKAVLLKNIGLGLGLAAGPLLSSLTSSAMHTIWDGHADVLLVLTTSATVWPIALFALVLPLLWYGIPGDLTTTSPLQSSMTQSNPNFGGLDARWDGARLTAVMSAIGILSLVHMGMQYIEVGSALLLEIKFKWHPDVVGLGIALALLAAMPSTGIVKFWLDGSSDMQTKFWRVRLSFLVLVLTSFFFMPIHVDILPDSWLILIADMLFFAFGIVSGSEMDCLLMTLTDDDGGIFRAANMQVLMGITWLARGIAGPLARFSISYSSDEMIGQATYAIAQMIGSFGVVVLATIFFFPSYKLCHDLIQGTKS